MKNSIILLSCIFESTVVILNCLSSLNLMYMYIEKTTSQNRMSDKTAQYLGTAKTPTTQQLHRETLTFLKNTAICAFYAISL